MEKVANGRLKAEITKEIAMFERQRLKGSQELQESTFSSVAKSEDQGDKIPLLESYYPRDMPVNVKTLSQEERLEMKEKF